LYRINIEKRKTTIEITKRKNIIRIKQKKTHLIDKKNPDIIHIIKKKRRDYLKKIIVFLIMIMTIFLFGYQNVYAEDYSFYEAEYLDKMYMNKYDYSTNTIYYQRARKFRNKKTYAEVYCIEPLTFFEENSTYHETTNPRNLTKAQIERIKKIAYFGYRYKNHDDGSWYAVAQLMIWREANPTGGDFYFTDTLNGNRTNQFDYQIDEINQLIKEYDNEIPLNNKTITLVEGTTQDIEIGNVLNFYSTNNQEIEIDGTHLKIKELPAGEYSVTLTRQKENYYNTPIVIYESPTSQDMMQWGDLEEKEVHFNIRVINNYIELTKTDEDTKDNIPQGDAKLDGALYTLYNEKDEIVDTIEIIDNKGVLKNIPFGNYYLKETIAGIGYQLNEEIYKIILTSENPNKELVVTNKVIEKEITIKKTYGEENKLPESNIDFEIRNQKDELIKTISTNQEGIVKTTLPYGTYKIKQINTTEGYQINNPFILKIENSEEETIELHDYKIPVPNTGIKQNLFIEILQILLQMLC